MIKFCDLPPTRNQIDLDNSNFDKQQTSIDLRSKEKFQPQKKTVKKHADSYFTRILATWNFQIIVSSFDIFSVKIAIISSINLSSYSLVETIFASLASVIFMCMERIHIIATGNSIDF